MLQRNRIWSRHIGPNGSKVFSEDVHKAMAYSFLPKYLRPGSYKCMGYLQGSDKRKNYQEIIPRTSIRRIRKYKYTVKEEIGLEGKSRK